MYHYQNLVKSTIQAESYDYIIVSEFCGCRELGVQKREQKCPSSCGSISCIRYQCRNTSVVSGIDAEIHQLYQVLMQNTSVVSGIDAEMYQLYQVWMQRYISCIRYGYRDTSVVSGMDAEALNSRSGMCQWLMGNLITSAMWEIPLLFFFEELFLKFSPPPRFWTWGQSVVTL